MARFACCVLRGAGMSVTISRMTGAKGRLSTINESLFPTMSKNCCGSAAVLGRYGGRYGRGRKTKHTINLRKSFDITKLIRVYFLKIVVGFFLCSLSDLQGFAAYFFFKKSNYQLCCTSCPIKAGGGLGRAKKYGGPLCSQRRNKGGKNTERQSPRRGVHPDGRSP